MTTTQIQYQQMKETVLHNRNTESQALHELGETIRHNKETESQGRTGLVYTGKQAEASMITAKANKKNAETNVKNAKTNAKNARTNERNAKTNERNAQINAKNAESNAKQAEAALLKAKSYEDLTVSQIGVNKANAAKLAKDLSNADVALLVKTGKIGKGVAAATLCANILADPKSNKELKDFAKSVIAQLKDDSSAKSKPLKATAKGIKESKKTWKSVQLTYKNGVWMFVPRK